CTRFESNPVEFRLVLRFGANFDYLRHQHVRQFIRFLKPVSNWSLDLVPMPDVYDVKDLGLRRPVNTSHLGRLERATEEYAEFEKVLLRTHEEVAGFAREHNRFVRGVNPLVAEGNRSLAQTIPSIP